MSSAKQVKDFLRTHGIETKNIRVSSENSINVKLLDPKLDYDKISQLLAEEFESYQRDEATGEILSGGNTFVFVEYDYDTIKEVQQNLQSTIRPFLSKCSGNWEISGLVRHYIETEPLEYDVHIVRRAIQEAFYTFLKENASEIDGLKVAGF